MTTSQYMSGALGVAVLVLVLGDAPGPGDFGKAFLTTALAATAGALLVWFGLPRRNSTPSAQDDRPAGVGGDTADAVGVSVDRSEP